MDIGKIGVYWDLLRKGQEVSDPEKWKKHQITATVVGGLIIAIINIAKAYGYELPITTDDANSLGVGIIALVNIVLTATTSKKAGLLPAKSQPAAVQQVVGDQESSSVSDNVQPVVSSNSEAVIGDEPRAAEPAKPVDDYIYRG